MTARVSLTDQIETVERAATEIGALLAEKAFYRTYPHMVDFEIDNLRAAGRTLAFMREHEQTIRDAISSARALDAAQREP